MKFFSPPSIGNKFTLAATSPQASSTFIFGFVVVPWVSCQYLGIMILIDVCQDDFEQVCPGVSS